MRDPLVTVGRAIDEPLAQEAAVVAPERSSSHLRRVRQLVTLREEALAAPVGDVTADELRRVLMAMFPPSSLELAVIDWASPRQTHDALERHEAVHKIADRADLRRRLQPSDRLCFGLFHDALPADPLVFTEIALTSGVPGSIAEILASDRVPRKADEMTTAVLYSISAAQPGLRGIAFGGLLISRVIAALHRDFPRVRDVVTLSPIPGLRRWLAVDSGMPVHGAPPEDDELRGVAEDYLRQKRRSDGRPADAVARFHLGNGASLASIHLHADPSERGIKQSFGAMASYRYERQDS